MIRTSIAWVLVVGCAGLACAQGVALEHQPARGQRVRVEERAASELTQRYVGRDAAGHRGSAGAVEVSVLERAYVEEVLASQPLRLSRRYELSTRAKYRRGDDPDPQRTSLHDRAVVVQGLELAPAEPGFEISKADREALRFDRLALALLPAVTVERGEEWLVPAEALGQALWGPYVPASNLEGSGAKVRLKGVRERDGRQVASLRVKALRVCLARTATLPGLELNLSGELDWDLEAGALREAKLEGRLSFSLVDQKDGAKVELQAEGPLSWSMTTTRLESRPGGEEARASGEPPPPGTKVLVCAVNPKHRLELREWLRCVRCGGELNLEQGCTEHGWLLQHCPHDGAPFRPE